MTAACSFDAFVVGSAVMGRDIRAAVALPPAYAAEPARRFPLLCAMHGSGAPYDTWTKMPPLHAALGEWPMIVACFDGDSTSWYLDSPLPQTGHLREGDRPAGGSVPPARSLFTTFFFDEFLPCLDRRYRTDGRRMLTGFSMGGFGAFHYLLTRPEAFSSVSALSGAFMPLAEPAELARHFLLPLLGALPAEQARYRAIDLELRLRDAVARGVRLPPLFFHCGTEDPVPGLLESNRDFTRLLDALGIPHRYLETAGGHDWPFWRDASAAIIDFHGRSLESC